MTTQTKVTYRLHGITVEMDGMHHLTVVHGDVAVLVAKECVTVGADGGLIPTCGFWQDRPRKVSAKAVR